MDKRERKDASKNKNKIIPKISKKNNLKKEKTTNTVLKESKKMLQHSKENLKSNKNNKTINISSKKYSMDNRETTSNTNINSNSNNMTDSSEILIDKKKIFKKEINNKKINLKIRYQKNSEEKLDKNMNSNNKDYNINPFSINNKLNNQNKINHIPNNIEKETDKEKDKDKENNKKYESKIINIDKKKINSDKKRQTYNKESHNQLDFSFEKNEGNTINFKDKDKENIYKNRFLTKIYKNKNISKERKSEGSFGSIINQKKLKLFSFASEQNNNFNINMKGAAIASISLKDIMHESGNREKILINNIKKDLKKIQQNENIDSARKKKPIEKKNSYKKINLNSSNKHKETKEILKLESKINKNREILFNSKGKIPKEKKEEKDKINCQLLVPNKNNNTNSKIIIQKRITYNTSQRNRNFGNRTFNLPKNKNKLYNSNTNLSKNKLEKLENKTAIRDFDKDKAINIKRNISPAKVDIDLDTSKSNHIKDDTLSEKPPVLFSERYSSLNEDSSIYSILKKNNKKGENLYPIDNLFSKKKFNKINKSPQIKRKNMDNNRIFQTKTEMHQAPTKNREINNISNENSSKNEINIYLNLEVEAEEIQKNKISKNQKNNKKEDIILPLNTLDNESFKNNTVKRLIKNNQYRTLLSEMATINAKKHKEKEDKNKEKERKIKKKYRFSERRRGSHKNEPIRKLTESSENYYDLYKKAFNDKSLEQKFSFRPKSKYKNLNHKYNLKNKDNEGEKNINKKISTASFNVNQKKILDNEININDFPFHKNVLSNNLDRSKEYDKEDENENENDNKNFILDLNHFIPIDENKLIKTFSKPLFVNDNPKNN